MKKLIASFAVIAAACFTFNANASNPEAVSTGTPTTTSISESKDVQGCWYCGYWYYWKNGKKYYGGRVRCCR